MIEFQSYNLPFTSACFSPLMSFVSLQTYFQPHLQSTSMEDILSCVLFWLFVFSPLSALSSSPPFIPPFTPPFVLSLSFSTFFFPLSFLSLPLLSPTPLFLYSLFFLSTPQDTYNLIVSNIGTKWVFGGGLRNSSTGMVHLGLIPSSIPLVPWISSTVILSEEPEVTPLYHLVWKKKKDFLRRTNFNIPQIHSKYHSTL